MIPILYKKDDTNYTRNGAGFLTDIISCDVTEERNGAYELTFEYPATGLHYSDISEGDVVKVKANETSGLQLFRIYAHSKPINGIVTFSAEHISYDANGIPLVALTAKSTTPQAAINKAIREGAFESSFTAWSDISTLNSIDITEPCSLRAVLGGQQGSILDVWGGEYEFDNYTIKLHAHRGADRGVTIEYGKNLTDIQQERNITETYTHILPYAMYTEQTDDGKGGTIDNDIVVTLPEKALPLAIAENVGHQKAAIINLSEMFGENEDINEQTLRNKANSYITAHDELGVPKVNIQASFVSLWQTEEYKDIAPLERVQLCDTVIVRFVKLGISTKAKVIKTVYDTLNEKYKSVELGEARSSFADTILEQEKAVTELVSVVRKGFSNATEELKRAIAEATALITGNSGGYVVLHPAEHPQEILIMDTPDIETAVRVWRWNSAGLGYSSTGYNGEFGLAMTMNGAIVADFITAGTLNGGLLRADSVEANAISAGFKQQIADNISGVKETVEQEFALADEELRSSITTSYTDAISASEGRTQTLIQQTRDGIMLDVYTKTETGGLISGAVDDANNYTDNKLTGYYTSTETDSKISVSAQNIMLQVYTKTQADQKMADALTSAKGYTDSQISVSEDNILLQTYTKSQTDTKISTAQTAAANAAKGYTDDQLKGYYTIKETDSKISASADQIMLSVYTKKETGNLINGAIADANDYTDDQLGSYYTKSETESKITASANGLTASFNTKLSNDYYTKTETDSRISISKDGILATVSKAQSKYDASGSTVDLYGYGAPASAGYAAKDYSGKYYLNQNNGYLYLSNGTSWTYQKALSLITTKLQSQITANATNINLKVAKGDVVSEINQSADTISLKAGRLIITTGNFQLSSTGVATMTGANINGKLTTSVTENSYLEINGNKMEFFSNSKRLAYITPVVYTTNSRRQLGFIASGNYDGLTFGAAFDSGWQAYYRINIQGAETDLDCRHYFVGDVKFANGKFKANVNFADNSGVAWGGNVGLRYWNDNAAYGNGLYLGISANACNTYVVGNSITMHCDTWVQNHTLYVRGGYVDIDDSYGISCTGTIAFRWINNDGLYVGMTGLDMKLVGSNIYAKGSPVATTSDSRQKQDITPLADKYIQMLKSIDPVSFKYDSDIALSGRTHTGFIAQNVLQAMAAADIDTTEFAAFVDVSKNGSEYALRYEEFISPLLAYVKHLEGRIAILETERTG